MAKLVKTYPHVKISAVMSHGQAPGFALKASDEDAKAIADEARGLARIPLGYRVDYEGKEPPHRKAALVLIG